MGYHIILVYWLLYIVAPIFFIIIAKFVMLQSRFKEITKLFYEAQYEQGFSRIQSLVQEKPQNSILYVNKALFLSLVGREEQAIQDLQRSLELNPSNYVAYFNLFSLQFRSNLDQQAFGNLCCALSAMYLIRGRIHKNINDLRRSILLANNNVEAAVLFSLLSLKMQNYQIAKQAIEDAEIANPENQILRKVRLQISRCLDPQYTQPLNSKKQRKMQVSSQKRLRCSIKMSRNTDITEETNEMLNQFNSLYNEINGSCGGITQRVSSCSSFLKHTETFMLQKSKIRSINQSVIAQLQDQQQFITKSTLNQVKPAHQKKREENQYDAVQSMVTAYPQSRNKDISIIQEAEEDRLSLQSQPAKLPQKHPFDLYPLFGSPRIRMNVIKLTLFQYQIDKTFQNVYCILAYGSKSKMITNAIPCRQGECLWNKIFQDIQLQREPANLKLKVYNKKRNEIRDQFIGDFQVLLTTADLIKLPVLNRQGQQVGSMMLHLQMMPISND